MGNVKNGKQSEAKLLEIIEKIDVKLGCTQDAIGALFYKVSKISGKAEEYEEIVSNFYNGDSLELKSKPVKEGERCVVDELGSIDKVLEGQNELLNKLSDELHELVG